jgi:hypothetical protein
MISPDEVWMHLIALLTNIGQVPSLRILLSTRKYVFLAPAKLTVYEGRLQVRGLTLLLRVGTLWRCGDGFFFEVPPLASDVCFYNAPPTSRRNAVDRWLLRNLLSRSSLFMVRKAQKSHGAISGLYGGCSYGIPPIHFFQAEQGSSEARNSKWSTVCGTFSRSGKRVVSSASLDKRGTWKKRPSPPLHKVPTRSNKVSPRPFQTAHVHSARIWQQNLHVFEDLLWHQISGSYIQRS